MHGFLGPRESARQTASRSVQPFLQGSRTWPTNRHTDHATCDMCIAIGRIYAKRPECLLIEEIREHWTLRIAATSYTPDRNCWNFTYLKTVCIWRLLLKLEPLRALYSTALPQRMWSSELRTTAIRLGKLSRRRFGPCRRCNQWRDRRLNENSSTMSVVNYTNACSRRDITDIHSCILLNFVGKIFKVRSHRIRCVALWHVPH